MPFLDLFLLVASGATIFGLIVGIFSVYSGRMTRREISRQIRESSVEISKMMEKLAELIATESEKTRELIKVLKG